MKRLFAVALLAGCATTTDDAALDDAAAAARAHDTLRPAIVSALQHEADAVDGAEAWAPAFNAFARSGAAALLLDHAEAAHKAGARRYDARTCARLRPLSALTHSAIAVARFGGAIEPGALLLSCDDGFCARPSIAAIDETCDFQPMAVPIAPS
ncbi:MAG: hypothetical protein GC206_15500 [Alphaproteobacteria bacterium]|nr:hypothetical protein [Alphaproteobacteria bacterium]